MNSSLNIRLLRLLFIITDGGFIIYWLVTITNSIPQEYLFKDYDNPIIMAWNWSFFPLDLAISCSGLMSLYYRQKGERNWQIIALVSLILTVCSGLQAIAFWVIRGDFDLLFWVLNLFLLIYPLYFIRAILRSRMGS